MIRWVWGAVLMGKCLFGMESLDGEKTSRFLDIVATAQQGEWNLAVDQLRLEFPEWLREKSVSETLAAISPGIIDGQQLDLVSLLQRAITNCSELSGEKTSPFIYRYKNYQAPLFSVPKIDLILDVRSDLVLVTSTLLIERGSKASSLVLHGKGHSVLSVSLNGSPLARELYRVTPNELILLDIPQEMTFQVEVKSEIDPYRNTTLQGLYQTGPFLITQCESESARQIFYTLDRPDVLSRMTTTLIADPVLYPVRISNGNLVEEIELSDGRKKIVWDDPIPKPSYLFACVLGDFGKISSTYTTKSGKKIDLEVYVEKNKSSSALYSLEMLKKAMEFDEQFFDREYDLNSMKMVAVPNFNMGAMENKGLMIFNERYLLVSQKTGTDADFRSVASVIAHEYFHNWTGNRVTIRNWFELALKEAFTDFRAMLFDEWLFGKTFIRPKNVMELRDRQFPEENSELGHPIMVESYVSPSEIYDATTYTKGREVFRALQTYLDLLVPDGFRRSQNLYFERHDGQAVTFRELLHAANDILAEAGKPGLAQFERWFDQQGTPRITATLHFDPDAKQLNLQFEQSCPHPKTGKAQEPFLIPFTYELLRSDGSVAVPKQTLMLTERKQHIQIPAEEKFIPIFLHDYCAPVILDYPYTLDELALLMKYASDPFTAWEAGQNFTLRAMRESDVSRAADEMRSALEGDSLSSLAKAELLSFPTLRTMAERWRVFDFPKLQELRERYLFAMATSCKPVLEKLLAQYPEPENYAPITAQMEIRQLRRACFNLLSRLDSSYLSQVYQNYLHADNFDTSLQSLRILAERGEKFKKKALDSYHSRWKGDTAALCYWLSVQASASQCTVNDIKRLMKADGFDSKNPNHIRASIYAFAQNLSRFHDPKGEGYRFVIDQIIALAQYNPMASFGLAKVAFLDADRLPDVQKRLLGAESKRLLSANLPPEVYELLTRVANVNF
ncbi:MAG: aminopeptidase N [Chlamydiales bacterium]|nr:aminopeptidase N [Chlamydiales bacterium]